LDELITRRFLASAEMVKVQGYTRLRFVRGKGPLPSPPSKVAPPAARSSPPEESGGDYGRTAEAWRRQMAAEHGTPSEQVQLWEKALALARQRSSEILYQAWLARTLLLDLNDGKATLLVPNAFSRDQIVETQEGLLQQALRELLHTDVTLVYRTAANAAPHPI